MDPHALRLLTELLWGLSVNPGLAAALTPAPIPLEQIERDLRPVSVEDVEAVLRSLDVSTWPTPLPAPARP